MTAPRPVLLECWSPVAHAPAGAVVDLARAIPELGSRLSLGQRVVVRGNDGVSRGAAISGIDVDGECRATLGPPLSRQQLAELGVVWGGQTQRLRRARLVVCP